jgi:hypothetical protein
LVCALPLLAFVLIWPHAVVAHAVIEPVVMFVVFMAALAAADCGKIWMRTPKMASLHIIPAAIAVGIAGLLAWNWDYLSGISYADEGDREIGLAQTIPRDNGQAVFMLPWGMRYSAVAFSHYVTGENADLAIADHKANFSALLGSGHTLYTDRDTFYTLPVSWWDAEIGHTYLSSPVLNVVNIRNQPELNASDVPTIVTDGIVFYHAGVECPAGNTSDIVVHVTWGATTAPSRGHDFSVFVHLIGHDATVATGDESAPVYGWYPTSRWTAGEVIPDTYRLNSPDRATAVQFGLYEQPTPGKFVNYGVTTLPLLDDPICHNS